LPGKRAAAQKPVMFGIMEDKMRKLRRNIFIGVCTIPTLILFVIFVVYPMLESLRISFFRWSGLSANSAVFIGLENFRLLAKDSNVWNALKNNLFLMLFVPLTTLMISLFFAVLFTKQKLPGKNFFRTVFFFPYVLSMVVVSVLWMFIYNPTFGILNSFLKTIGMEKLTRAWLGEPSTALICVSITMIWQWIGFYMVLYIAAIENIPVQLYEAAVIDGAGEVRQFMAITFPMIWEVTRVNVVLLVINVFNASFGYVKVMTNGGPDSATEVLSSYMYRQAFVNSNLGYATANAVLIFVILVILTTLSSVLTRKEAVEF